MGEHGGTASSWNTPMDHRYMPKGPFGHILLSKAGRRPGTAVRSTIMNLRGGTYHASAVHTLAALPPGEGRLLFRVFAARSRSHPARYPSKCVGWGEGGERRRFRRADLWCSWQLERWVARMTDRPATPFTAEESLRFRRRKSSARTSPSGDSKPSKVCLRGAPEEPGGGSFRGGAGGGWFRQGV